MWNVKKSIGKYTKKVVNEGGHAAAVVCVEESFTTLYHIELPKLEKQSLEAETYPKALDSQPF